MKRPAAVERRFLVRWPWLGLVTAGLLLLLLILISAFYLTTTSRGLQLLLLLGQRSAPGELQVERVEGTLTDTLVLHRVRYRAQGTSISLQRLKLAWDPTMLLFGRLHIHDLYIEQPLIELPPKLPSEPAGPIQLPAIDIPLQLRVERLQLHKLRLEQARPVREPSEQLRLKNVLLKLHSRGRKLVLDQLRVEADLGWVDVSGVLTPEGYYPLRLDTGWELRLPDRPPLRGRGTIAGDLTELALDQQLAGLLDTRVLATLTDPLNSPAGALQMEELAMDLGIAVPELEGYPLRGHLNVTGNFHSFALRGRWQLRLPEIGDSDLQFGLNWTDDRLVLEQVRLRQRISGAELQLQGTAGGSFQAPEFSIDGQWNQIRYPFGSKAAYLSRYGKFNIRGTPEHYRLGLSGDLQGDQIPSGFWQLEADGTPRGFAPLTLAGETLDGRLLLTGEVTWNPALSWQLAVTGQQLDPSRHWPDWPGRLDLRARSHGSLDQRQQLQLQADLHSVSGILREAPLRGGGRVVLKDGRWQIRQLQLEVADADLRASGDLGTELNLDWTLNAPNLTKILPGSQGRLTGQGTLRGPAEQLQLAARLEGDGLQLENVQIANLDAMLDLDLSARRHSRIRLRLDQPELAGQRWQQLSLEVHGMPGQHQLQLSLDQGPAELQLALDGSWQSASWRGSLSRADLSHRLLGNWQLRRPAVLQAAATGAALDRLCWQRLPTGTGSLCLEGNWSADQGVRGMFEARQLGLDLLAPLLPPDTRLEGRLQAQGEFQQRPGERPGFEAGIRLLNSRLLLEQEDLEIAAGEIRLQLDGRQQRLNARLQIPLRQPTGALRARLAVDDLYGQADLSGDLDLHLSELRFISLIVPQVQAVSGRVSASLVLSGSLRQPEVKGHLRLRDAGAELPALGTRLDAVELTLRDRPDSSALELQGMMKSGEGTLKLNGECLPSAKSCRLALAGDRFQAVATSDIRVWISPEVEIAIAPQLVQLRGEVSIPEARVSRPDISSAVSLSPDVVILNQQVSNESVAGGERRLDARLRIRLGDRVEVDDLGFRGRLLGSILVEDDGRRAARASGRIQVASGQYRLYGQQLNIERGSLIFSGGPLDNPGLDLRISRQVNEVSAGARVSGTLRAPRLDLFSTPPMSENSLLFYLLFGRSPDADSATFSEQELALKAASMLMLKSGQSITEQLPESLQVDDLGFESGDSATDTALYIGKYLSPRLYVKYGVGLLEPTTTFLIRYRLSKHWSLESQTGPTKSGGDIIYTLER